MTEFATPKKPFVLAVDSDCHRGRSLVSRLKTAGCYMAFSACGGDALKYAAENEPDAIVSDWRLSDMTGAELTRELKSQLFRTRVLLLSDQADWRQLRRTLECGGDDLLSRPVSIEYLLRTLDRSFRMPRGVSQALR